VLNNLTQNASQSEIQDILVECYRNDKVFCKTFFPESFDGPFTTLHDAIFDLINSDARKVAIAAPRGIGKTTIARTKAAKNMLYRDSRFIVYVSLSHDAAMLQTENLKRSLVGNSIVRKVFGPIKPKNLDKDFQETFSKRAWVGYETLVLPRGAQQQIRGLVYNNNRPDLFIVDDLEDDELISNPEYRKQLKTWFNAVLLKAVSRYSHNWRIIYIDTLKHEDSLLQDLLDDPDWESIRLELCDDSLKSNVPEIMSDEDIQKEYEYHERNGILDVFYREYRNLPVSTKDATFKKEYFKYYEPQDLEGKLIDFVVLGDPAKTAKFHSADSAIVGVGIDTKGHAIYVHDIVYGKLHPDEFYDELFSMAFRLNASVIAVEETGLNEFIKQPIKNEAVKRNCKAELVWLKARGGSHEEKGKDRRIAALAPYYRLGYIYHNKGVCNVLETQLLSFPRAKRKDVMDAFSYIVELLDIGDRYFEPPEYEGQEDDEDALYEKLELESDEPLEGWRVA